jgi:hypothetical protein
MNVLTKIRPAGLILALPLLLLALWNSSQAQQVQIDPRFGSVGREGAASLNLAWYREYQRQNNDPVLPGKHKYFVVGQIPNRTDTLGIDWQWYLLDLLEQPNSLLLQHFLNLVLDMIQSDALPVVRETWQANRDDLEALWAQTVNGTSKTWKKKVLGVTIYSYTVRLSDTKVSIPEELPAIQLTVAPDGQNIILTVDLEVEWSTHARGSNGSIHAWPTFHTQLSLIGIVGFEEDEKGRYLYIKEVQGKSVTDAEGDIKFVVNILNIGRVTFTWRKLDILIQSQIDRAVENGIGKIMEVDQNQDGQPDLAQHFYFEPFLSKTFFDGKPLPRQQEILDRIFAQESEWIRKKIEEQGQRGAYWEIGNEPNWFPLMRPEQYAAVYTRYYHLIKSLDPTAKCMLGGLFLKEVIENPREIVLVMIPDILSLFREELATFITNALFETSTVAWFEAFRAALPAEINVDLGNFHLYPIQGGEAGFELARVTPQIETLTASFAAHGISETWLTEFGNIDWRRSENDAASLCWQLVNYLKQNAVGITRWFWSRSIGYDRRFDAIGRRPLTALLADDGTTLTAIGRAYQLAATLGTTDVPAFDLASAPVPQSLTLLPNYPNPFSATGGSALHHSLTRIPYALPEASEMRLQIFDIMGRLTREIVHAQQPAGWYEAAWDGRNELGNVVASGTYFVVLRVKEKVQTRKLIVTR